MSTPNHFWTQKTLEQFTFQEWELLCDGCGKCCLFKLEDEVGKITYTNVACRLLDLNSCRCTEYRHRQKYVSDCVTISRNNLKKIKWLPTTCGYRLVAEGNALKWWHPLVSGDPETVKMSGNSVYARSISETQTTDLNHHLIDWIKY